MFLSSNKKHVAVFLLLLCLISNTVFAHTVNYALEKAPTGNVILFYLKLGIQHIIPFGIDHILFIVGLCLLSTNIKTIFWQATAFTIAHSITLAMSMKNIITLPAQIVEPIIALSILFVAIENIILNELKAWRILIVFLFGLIHGLGFASALNEIGLPRNKFLISVFSFNLGVEVGQVTIIGLVFLFIILPAGKKLWYKKAIAYPLSAIIGLIAAYWTVQRIITA
jgi:hydrogenase/urease accessory protein HupE